MRYLRRRIARWLLPELTRELQKKRRANAKRIEHAVNELRRGGGGAAA